MHAALTMFLPHLAISRQGWLFAHTFALAGLAVYRSPYVTDDSEMYQPVAELLSEHQMTLVLKEIIPDDTMMFAEGVLEVYSCTAYGWADYPDQPVGVARFTKQMKGVPL